MNQTEPIYSLLHSLSRVVSHLVTICCFRSVGFVFLKANVTCAALFERARHRRHVHCSGLQLLFKNIDSSQSTYFSLQVIKRHKHGHATGKGKSGILAPLLDETVNVSGVLNCNERKKWFENWIHISISLFTFGQRLVETNTVCCKKKALRSMWLNYNNNKKKRFVSFS